MPGSLTCAGGWRDDRAAGHCHVLAEPALGRRRVRVRSGILPASARPHLPSQRSSADRADRGTVRRASHPATSLGGGTARDRTVRGIPTPLVSGPPVGRSSAPNKQRPLDLGRAKAVVDNRTCCVDACRDCRIYRRRPDAPELTVPTTAEQTLLGYLPLALTMTNSCTRNSEAEQDTANVHASVICAPNGDVNRVVFTRFNSHQALHKCYQAAVAATGIGESLGDCRTADRAESVYTSDSGRTSGRVLCYQKRGVAFVEWTDDGSRTLGVVTQTDPDHEKLRFWWAAVVGVEIN